RMRGEPGHVLKDGARRPDQPPALRPLRDRSEGERRGQRLTGLPRAGRLTAGRTLAGGRGAQGGPGLAAAPQGAHLPEVLVQAPPQDGRVELARRPSGDVAHVDDRSVEVEPVVAVGLLPGLEAAGAQPSLGTKDRGDVLPQVVEEEITQGGVQRIGLHRHPDPVAADPHRERYRHSRDYAYKRRSSPVRRNVRADQFGPPAAPPGPPAPPPGPPAAPPGSPAAYGGAGSYCMYRRTARAWPWPWV